MAWLWYTFVYLFNTHSLRTHIVWVRTHLNLTQQYTSWIIPLATRHCTYLHLSPWAVFPPHFSISTYLRPTDFSRFNSSGTLPWGLVFYPQLGVIFPSSVILKRIKTIALYGNTACLFMHIYWFNKHLLNDF